MDLVREAHETTEVAKVADAACRDWSARRQAPVYALQPVALTDPMLLAELYRRDAEGGAVEERQGSLFLAQHASVDFGAFVNVFFEWHWLRYTGCVADVLELLVEGVGEVSVTRVFRNGRAEEVAGQRLQSGRTLIALPSSRSPGTLSFAVSTQDAKGLTIKSAIWSTHAPPRQTILVDIAICTFNKLDMLRPSLDALCSVGLATAGIGRAIVVDQGSDKLMADEALGIAARNAMASGRLLIIEQANLGGSGGFTRGIMEALREEGASACTHVLLMDDDILFEPRLLSRLVAFLSRLPEDAVVGGSMVDMMRPHHMFAYSERFNCQTAHCERLYPNSLDLRERSQLTEFEKAPDGNYNGWFICCFPRSAFDKHGLPLPVFVRSDDCEFGLRLCSRGFPLVHMPALFVWHEPFWLKRRAWIEVYTLRNHLIVANVSSQRYRWFLAIKRLGEFWYYVGTYQYGMAYACCMAIESYLEGPDSIFRRTLYWHEKILSQISQFEEKLRSSVSVPRSGLCPQRGARPRSPFHPMLPNFVRWLLNVAWNLWGRQKSCLSVMEAQQAVPQDQLSWHSFHQFPVVLSDVADGRTSLVLIHDAAVARRLTARMLKVTVKLLWSGARRRREYRRAVETYGSKSFWESTFASLQTAEPLSRSSPS